MSGRVAERLNAAVLKTVDAVRRPGVQIPPLPPDINPPGRHDAVPAGGIGLLEHFNFEDVQMLDGEQTGPPATKWRG